MSDDYLVSRGRKISKIRSGVIWRAYDTENRTFELRGEFNRKKAQISTLRPMTFSPYAKQGRELAARERLAIKIFM